MLNKWLLLLSYLVSFFLIAEPSCSFFFQPYADAKTERPKTRVTNIRGLFDDLSFRTHWWIACIAFITFLPSSAFYKRRTRRERTAHSVVLKFLWPKVISSVSRFNMVSRSKSKNDKAARLARLSSTSAYSSANFSTLSPPPVESKKLLGFGSSKSVIVESALEPIEHDDLKQGSLYIIKIRNVSVALFEGTSLPRLFDANNRLNTGIILGWDDDMCCFAVLRKLSRCPQLIDIV